MTAPPWDGIFEVLDSSGAKTADQGLPLLQVTDSSFQLGARVRYLGETGLDPALDDVVRELPVDLGRRSDLASVPAALRWFERAHGVHTPAALFHDYLLRVGDRVRADQADLMFRHMLEALGVPVVKRNLMWAAVVMRTRWFTSPVALILWTVLSAGGIVLFVLTLLGVDMPGILGNRPVTLVAAALAPFPASLLWGRERRAALVAAAMAIWILPAAAIALLALVAYRAIEAVVTRVWAA